MVKSWFGQASTNNSVISTRCFSDQANEGKVFNPLLLTHPLQFSLSSSLTYIQQRNSLTELLSAMTLSGLHISVLSWLALLLTAMPIGEKKITNRLFINPCRVFSSSHYSWPYMV